MNRKLLLALAAIAAAASLPAPGLTQKADSAAIGEANDTPFVYDIPDRTMALPALAEHLEAEREAARAGLQERQAENDQYTSDSAMQPLAYHQSWTIAGEYGRLLSLSSAIYSYDGGAHGNTAYDIRIWDTEDDHGVDFASLFTDRYAAYALIDRPYCERLAAMQIERGIDPQTDEYWTGCQLLHEQTLVLASEPGQPFTAIVVMVPPYAAGPYAAGSFEIPVEITPALRALLRPEYRASFVLTAQQ